uniref:TRC8-like N-terminal domain-containing protein n=1 Tax=Sinocyclocheilus grahami TaxID=75366 RepID=A0A672LEG9_SINGR
MSTASKRSFILVNVANVHVQSLTNLIPIIPKSACGKFLQKASPAEFSCTRSKCETLFPGEFSLLHCILVSSVVLVLSQKSLFKFYTLLAAVLLGAASVLINYYSTSHVDFYSAYNRAALGFGLLPRSGATLWLGLALLQLLLGLGYVALLNVQSFCAALLVLDIMAPLWGLMLEADLVFCSRIMFGRTITSATVIAVYLDMITTGLLCDLSYNCVHYCTCNKRMIH